MLLPYAMLLSFADDIFTALLMLCLLMFAGVVFAFLPMMICCSLYAIFAAVFATPFLSFVTPCLMPAAACCH